MNKYSENKIFNRINDIILNDNFINFYNIEINSNIVSKLKQYQILHVQNLIYILKTKNYVLDGSDTGTGKTYTAIATAKSLNLNVFIICPYTIIFSWEKICSYFGIKPLEIINYEKIIKGNNKYVEINDNNEYYFDWKLPENSIIIFDEAHKCKNIKTLCGKLLLSTIKQKYKVLLLSATISDTIETFAIYGYLFGLYKKLSSANKFLKTIIKDQKKRIGFDCSTNKNTLHKIIYPKNGSRMELKELDESSGFIYNRVSVDCYPISENEKQLVNNALKNLKYEHDLEKISIIRQKLENIKIKIINDLTKQYLENNLNVVIFMNFNKNIDELGKLLKTTNIVNGECINEKRKKIINDFQSNKINLLICNIKCAVGISLHDLHGKQRVSIICPNFSSTDLIQSLGRIYRSDLKTPAIQKIIFCADTYEEQIYLNIKNKLDFIDKMNDSDFSINNNK